MADNKFVYYCDKETKNTHRFQPDYQAVKTIGQATIYLNSNWLKSQGIDPKDGLTITIEKGGSK